ncbi:MAG: hypothetical protein FJX29_14050 [Alphaproteobacteria bacterium]|nr:hypothetical protein [Alphaproteobacteria bacterium]
MMQRLAGFVAHDGPRTAAANRFALLLAVNQPFYPLYVWYFAGEGWAVSLWTLLSTPFFLAVPLVARWSGLAARVLLGLAALGNTFICMALFGEASLVAAFLAPCAVLIALLFNAEEWRWSGALSGGAALAFLVLRGRWPAPAHGFSAAQLESFATLHIWSASMLCVLIIWIMAPGRDGVRPPE